MPTWGELLQELSPAGKWATAEGHPDLDGLRHHHIKALSEHTGRNTVVYATDWLSSAKAGSSDLSIVLSDVQGLMEVFRNLKPADGLDLILHSPGGDPTAADSLVRYMRSKFEDVRVIVPLAAMSAATMWSLSANEIVLGKHSQLGPIDPQLGLAGQMIPAGAIKRTFEKAQTECATNPSRINAWVPTLSQYFPGLLEMCDDYTKLSQDLVAEYLERYMFAGRSNALELAVEAAAFFADDREHIAHSRGIGREKLMPLELKITNLEDDPELQDRVLSIFHSYTHTFSMSSTVKIVENQNGVSWMRAL